MNNRAWYALRRTLPPWRFEETLEELIRKAPEYKIDEVIVKVDTEEFSHGHPTVGWVKSYQEKLFEIKRKLTEIGVIYSLNPWITVGHCDRGRNDLSNYPGLRTVVGHDGTECRHCACPLSEVWRKHFQEIWTLYAATGPHVIWVEDDIRTFNHRPVTQGCFCDLHMAEFSDRAGRPVTREELVGEILHAGDVHEWRNMYLQMQQEIMIDTVRMIARTVHEVSPETSLGLMSSGARRHSMEGRDWHKFAEALADGRPLYSRPPMGNYAEGNLRGFYYSGDSIKLTRHALPDHIIEQTEVENVPFTRYSKSVNFTFVEMAISFAFGSLGVTMNLYDHAGTPMAVEEHYGKMLHDRKDYLSALTGSGTMRGVRLLFQSESSRYKKLTHGAPYGELAGDGYEMMEALESAGIPTTYEENGNPVAVSGQTLHGLPDGEIRKLLQGGLFLDAVAAGVLIEKGLGKEIGLSGMENPRCRETFDVIISAEAFGGKILTASLPNLNSSAEFAVLTPVPETEILSYWIDPDARRIMPAMTAFENDLGGRVVVHGLNYATAVGLAFHHPFRTEQLQQVIRYISGGRPEIIFNSDGAFPLAWRRDSGDHEIIGVFNLNLDDWSECRFDLFWDKALPEISLLTAQGKWLPDESVCMKQTEQVLQIELKRKIGFNFPLVIKLEAGNHKTVL